MAFNITIDKSPEILIAEVKAAVIRNNGKFSGDAKEGNIEISTPLGKVRCAYNIVGYEVQIQILEKSFFLTEEKIKTELLKMLKKS